jgi:hypothetical protein
MKAFKAICSATVLALALSVPTYAGDILTPGVVSPPPPPSCATLGEISTYSVESTSPGVDETPVLIDLLWAIVSIF